MPFSHAFQLFVQGRPPCDASVPCGGEPGRLCECRVRSARAQKAAAIIRADRHSPDFPEELGVDFSHASVVYHLPIFVLVCSYCGQREDVYEKKCGEAAHVPPHWISVARHIEGTFERVYPGYCSHGCYKASQDYVGEDWVSVPAVDSVD